MTPLIIESQVFVEALSFDGPDIVLSHADVSLRVQSCDNREPLDPKPFRPTDHRLFVPGVTGRVIARTDRAIGLAPDDFEPPSTEHPMMLNLDALPGERRELLLQTWDELEDLARRVVRLCRWKLKLNMRRAEPVHIYRFLVPRPDEPWGCYRYPVRRLHPLPKPGTDAGPLLSASLANGAEEPVARALLHEALVSRDGGNLRAALALAVAAAEVGVKGYVADVLPDVEWLVLNLPAPPIDKMCRELLPTLKGRSGGAPVIPKEMVTRLKVSIENRNKLIHRGASVDEENATSAIAAVSALLDALEFAQGV